jgi:response regulator RpfG family c-di-GMP phosphodiesterase
LQIENAWQTEIAAMLSQIGCMTIPEEILSKARRGAQLNEHELRLVESHPRLGNDLINRIPRLSEVGEIIFYQDKRYNGAGFPHDDRHGWDIPHGARVLKVALDFDRLIDHGMSNHEALKEIEGRGEWYDSTIVFALRQGIDNDIKYERQIANVDQLAPNMVLDEDLFTTKGMLLVSRGNEVTRSLSIRLKNFAAAGSLRGPLNVLVPVIES